MSTGQLDPMTQWMMQAMAQKGPQQQYGPVQGGTGPMGQVQQAPPASVLGSVGGATEGLNKAMIMLAMRKMMAEKAAGQQPQGTGGVIPGDGMTNPPALTPQPTGYQFPPLATGSVPSE